jgi:phenylpropionate dioxygenase-like ring-hydroxylating dioxygenase large terminal subunit
MEAIWLPIIKASTLRGKPVDASFLNERIVLFRASKGELCAVQRDCPHRGHDLIYGKIKSDGLQCPYHGWTYAADGIGRSPGNPKATCPIKTYAVCEYLGYVWLRAAGEARFEESESFRALQLPDVRFTGAVVADFDGPLSVVVDNFNEIEHTGAVHGMFGYPIARLSEVETTWQRQAPGRFAITSMGPQKPIAWPLRQFLRLGANDYFSGDWTVSVRPWLSSYVDRWYAGPTRDAPMRSFGMDLRIFFVPLSESRTRLFTFIFCTGLRLHAVARHVLTALIRYEVSLDQRVVSRLIEPERPLVGRRLGRFDVVLHQIRKDAEEIYS